MKNDHIYLDNAATTRTDPDVVQAMLPYFTETYAVASSQFSHTPGIMSKEGLDHSRQIIADKLNVSPTQIVFTSGGTESNNLAIKGTFAAFKGQKNHIICSKVEHNSVLHTCQYLERNGAQVTYLDVDKEGFIDPVQLENAIVDNTFLVSIQHGNQEVGTLQDIELISKICNDKGVAFHTDAALTFTKLPLDLGEIKVDLMTLSAHKIHGPKGVGALYIRKDTPIEKLVHGGYSEFDKRPGTENVSGIVGFGKAVEIASEEHVQHLNKLQKRLLDGFEKNINGFRINGSLDMSKRIPGNLNVSFDYIEGESVVLHMDMKGVAIITGSACFSRSLEPSYVMMGMGFTHERAHGSIRFTMSRFNTEDEMDEVVNSIKEIVENLRRISPLKN
ncbi:cysteine desulfurase [bacterium]|nr:cysteine desulfurase [bacterium]